MSLSDACRKHRRACRRCGRWRSLRATRCSRCGPAVPILRKGLRIGCRSQRVAPDRDPTTGKGFPGRSGKVLTVIGGRSGRQSRRPCPPSPAPRLSTTPHHPKDDKLSVHFRHPMVPLPNLLRTRKNVEGRFSSDCFSSTSTNRKVLNVRRTWTDKLSRFSSMS